MYMDMLYTHNAILLSHTKEQHNDIYSNMEGPRHFHKSNKNQISHNISYMRNLRKKIQRNLFTKQKQTYRLRKKPDSYQRRNVGDGDKLGVWDKYIHMTLYTHI